MGQGGSSSRPRIDKQTTLYPTATTLPEITGRVERLSGIAIGRRGKHGQKKAAGQAIVQRPHGKTVSVYSHCAP